VLRKFWQGYQIGVNGYEDNGDEQELQRARTYAGLINAIYELMGEGRVHFRRLQDDLGYQPIPMDPPDYIEEDIDPGDQTDGGMDMGAAPLDPTAGFETGSDEPSTGGPSDWKEAVFGPFMQERQKEQRRQEAREAMTGDEFEDESPRTAAYLRDRQRKREQEWEKGYEKERRGEPEFQQLIPLSGEPKERYEQRQQAQENTTPDIQANRNQMFQVGQAQFQRRERLDQQSLTDNDGPEWDELAWEETYEQTEEAQERQKEERRREVLESFDPAAVYDPVDDVSGEEQKQAADTGHTGAFVFGLDDA
jgi:hypothetical protein